MWNTLATFRENLSQIASEVLDTAEELEAGGSQEEASASHDNESSQSRFQRYSTLIHSKSNGHFEEKDSQSQPDVKHTGGLPVLPKSSVSPSPLKWSGSLYVDGDSAVETSGMPSSFDKRPEDLELKLASFQEREKELIGQVSAKEKAYQTLKEQQETVLAEFEWVKQELSRERVNLSEKSLQLRRQKEALDEVTRECSLLKDEKDQLHDELAELHKREAKEVASQDQIPADFQSSVAKQIAYKDAKLAELEKTVAELRDEKLVLQAEKKKLLDDLKSQPKDAPELVVAENCDSSSAEAELRDLKSQVQRVDILTKRLKMVEETSALERLEHQKRLDAVAMERDKAIRDLSRLKQHLLDKELADSEKMDQDSEQIQELEARATISNARALQLEQSLSLALANNVDSMKRSAEELQRAREEVEMSNRKLNNALLALESKDAELVNLQSALGQYYAESEAKERLDGELRSAREEIKRLLEELRAANKLIESLRQEKVDVSEKLALEEQKLLMNQQRTQKLEEDVLRLRHALEQSLTRINRMSSDSDYYVDRRIVIKLLVTYFQRKHSQEVLDLMARMLGFSEEDKRRVGLAHENAGKAGVVKSVLGLPSRFVGGLLGSGVSNSTIVTPENQSFADLWIDFLLKESEERDRRERAESDMKPVERAHGFNHGPSSSLEGASNTNQDGLLGGESISQRSIHSTVNRNLSDSPKAPLSPQYGNHNELNTVDASWKGSENGISSRTMRGDIKGAEFSTIPLNSSFVPSRANFGLGKFVSKS